MQEEIIEILREINPYVDIDAEVDLLEKEILDSLGLVALIIEVEKKYGIEIPMEDLKLENFKNVCSIAEFVKTLQKEEK